MSRKSRYLLPTLLILLWILLFTSLSFTFHAAMRTNRSDLGQIAQAIWNSSRGRFLENTDAGFIATRLTDHVEPILVLISPLLWLWDDTRALLLLQVVAVAMGGLFVYALANRQNHLRSSIHPHPVTISARESLNLNHQSSLQGPVFQEPVFQGPVSGDPSIQNPKSKIQNFVPLAFLLAYLLAPQLQHAVMTEFHAAPLAVPLLLWAFWATEERRWWHFTLATLLVAGVKEEMALVAAGLPVWAFYRNWQRQRMGNVEHENVPTRGVQSSSHLLTHPLSLMVLSFVCFAWFIIATFVIVPAYAPLIYDKAETIYLQRYGDLGDSPLSILKTLLTDPLKVWSVVSQPARMNYLWGLLVSFGFLSLLSPEILLLSLPLLMANLFSQYPGQYYNEFHYSAPLISYIAVSAIYGYNRLRHFFRRILKHQASIIKYFVIVWLLAWSLFYYLELGRGPLGGRYDPLVVNDHHRLLARFITQIPADAPLTATAAIHPHLSHRRYIYQFPLGIDSEIPADWALLDILSKNEMAPGDLFAAVNTMLQEDWGVVDAADGFLLLHKGESNKHLPDAFYDAARTPVTVIQTMQRAGTAYGCAVNDWARWRETEVMVDQLTVQDIASATQRMMIQTPSGEIVYDMAGLPAPASIWLPPYFEPRGGLRLTTLPLYLPRTWAVLLRQPDASFLPNDGSLGLLCVWSRLGNGQLVELSPTLASQRDWIDHLAERLDLKTTQTTAELQINTSLPLQLHGWVANRATWPGDRVDIWLQWVGKKWPANHTVFVHLRHNNENQAQADGMPRYFVVYSVQAEMLERGFSNDWRQLSIPPTAQPGEKWDVIVGLYDQQTMQRAEVVDPQGQIIGNEVRIGQIEITSPPIPDQTCAMIKDLCSAQGK